ncbi:MAG: tetratricopeptide repeat protein [Flavobacteriales bacterium]|nr:tetratricopeptide repeat protein [Flavobacteriales bacterium]
MMWKRIIYLLTLSCSLLASGSVFAQTETDEQLAGLYLQQKDYEKAVYYYEKLFESRPDNYYYQPLLTCYLELADFKKAEKLVRKQIKNNPTSLAYQVDLGYVYRKSGEDKDAEQQYEKTVRELPAIQKEVIDLANTFMGKGETRFAVVAYLRGRVLFNGIYTFNMELAEIYAANGEYIKMFEEYISLLDQDPSYIQTVQNALQAKIGNDVTGERRELLKSLLLKHIQKYPDAVVFSELLTWYYMQEKQFGSALIQAKALDKRLRENGQRIMNLAAIATQNRDYDVAIDCYNYIIGKGNNGYHYPDARVLMLEVMYLKITTNPGVQQSEITTLQTKYKETLNEFGISDRTSLMVRDLAHLEAFYLHDMDAGIGELTGMLEAPGISKSKLAEVKLELADIYLLTGERWEATLLYSQVEKDFKNDPIGHQAKLRNAKLSYYMGDFNWAKAQLDVLKAATTKLIANDALDLSLLITDNQDGDSLDLPLQMYARADLLSFRNKDSLALLALDSISQLAITHALADEILFKKAEIMEKHGRFKEAANFYQKIIDNYSFDILADNALFNLAELYQYRLNDPTKAMELYQKLLVDHPGSLLSVEARKRFRELRGDKLN